MPRKRMNQNSDSLTKSAVESNVVPNQLTESGTTRTKLTKVEREMNTALSLMDLHREQTGPHADTMSSQRLSEFERGRRKENGLAQYKAISTEKHTDNMRHKIAYVADQLIEEMAHEVSKKTKKDKEYLKGLTWSFGVLHDKLTAVNTEATLVSLPTKLLTAVKDVIQAQVELAKASAVKANASTNLRSSQQGTNTTDKIIDVTPVGRNEVSINDLRNNEVSSPPERSDTHEKLPT